MISGLILDHPGTTSGSLFDISDYFTQNNGLCELSLLSPLQFPLHFPVQQQCCSSSIAAPAAAALLRQHCSSGAAATALLLQ